MANQKKARSQPKNIAKVLKALKEAWELLDGDDKQLMAYSDTEMLMNILKPAISSKPRNCDRFETLGEISMHDSPIQSTLVTASREELLTFILWLFDTNKKGSKVKGVLGKSATEKDVNGGSASWCWCCGNKKCRASKEDVLVVCNHFIQRSPDDMKSDPYYSRSNLNNAKC